MKLMNEPKQLRYMWSSFFLHVHDYGIYTEKNCCGAIMGHFISVAPCNTIKLTSNTIFTAKN